MAGVRAVTFGGVAADVSKVPDDAGTSESFEVPVPAGPIGTVPVLVITVSGTSSPFAGFADFTYRT